MVPEPAGTRRHVLAGVGAGLAAVTGCASLPSDAGFQFRRGGFLGTSEPILTDADVSLAAQHPYQYARLVRSEEEARRVRWSYLRGTDPVFADKFAETDYDEAFLAVAGLVLPRNRTFGRVDSTFEGSSMHQTFEVVDASARSTEPRILNAVEHWLRNGHEPPSTLTTAYEFAPD